MRKNSKSKPQGSLKTNVKASSQKNEKKKHTFLKIAAVLLVVWWFNNFTLKVEKVKLVSPKITAQVRIAVISDIHADCGGVSCDSVADTVIDEKPDAVFILGDMFSSDSTQEIREEPVEMTKKIISNGLAVYFISGDHDYDENYVEAMKSAGAHCMNYAQENLDINGVKIHLMGIDNVYYSPTFSVSNAFANDADSYNILLAHMPKYDSFAQFGAELTLCGDTHGNMVQLPLGLGSLYDSKSHAWLPKLRFPDMKIYDKGYFEYDGGGMFISAGIGLSPAPLRFNNRPEVNIIELMPQ